MGLCIWLDTLFFFVVSSDDKAAGSPLFTHSFLLCLFSACIFGDFIPTSSFFNLIAATYHTDGCCYSPHPVQSPSNRLISLVVSLTVDP